MENSSSRILSLEQRAMAIQIEKEMLQQYFRQMGMKKGDIDMLGMDESKESISPAPSLYARALADTMAPHQSFETVDTAEPSDMSLFDEDVPRIRDWDEYISFMLQVYTEKDAMKSAEKPIPLPRVIHLVPDVFKFQPYTDIFLKIHYQPNTLRDPSTRMYYSRPKERGGKYITVSSGGAVNFWNADLKNFKSTVLEPESHRTKVSAVSTAVVATNLNLLVVAFMTGNMVFYDISRDIFSQVVILSHLEACVTCLDWWVWSNDITCAKLLWGDLNGNVGVIEMRNCRHTWFLYKEKHSDPPNFIDFRKLMKDSLFGVKAHSLLNVHKDVVSCIKYIHTMDPWDFMSCCRDTSTAVCIASFNRKVYIKYLSIPRGCKTFDYTRKSNNIATAGNDSIVRVWNPKQLAKPIMNLQCSGTPILFVFLDDEHDIIYTIEQDKTILVFDMNRQIQIQIVPFTRIPMGPRHISAATYNHARNAMVLGNNVLGKFEHHPDIVVQPLMTQNRKFSFVLYSNIYDHVICGNTDSVISIWNIDTGKKISEFTSHSITLIEGGQEKMELTTMRFDKTQRRLLTAGRDNYLKVWNYREAMLLLKINFEVEGVCGITDIMNIQNFIVTGNENNRITLYVDAFKSNESDPGVTWAEGHKTSVTCLAVIKPDMVISGSADGDILLWKVESGAMKTKLNANLGTKPIIQEQILITSSHKDTRQLSMMFDELTVDDSTLEEFLSFNTRRTSIAAAIPLISRRTSMLPGVGEEGNLRNVSGAATVLGFISKLKQKSRKASTVGEEANLTNVSGAATVLGFISKLKQKSDKTSKPSKFAKLTAALSNAMPGEKIEEQSEEKEENNTSNANNQKYKIFQVQTDMNNINGNKQTDTIHRNVDLEETDQTGTDCPKEPGGQENANNNKPEDTINPEVTMPEESTSSERVKLESKEINQKSIEESEPEVDNIHPNTSKFKCNSFMDRICIRSVENSRNTPRKSETGIKDKDKVEVDKGEDTGDASEQKGCMHTVLNDKEQYSNDSNKNSKESGDTEQFANSQGNINNSGTKCDVKCVTRSDTDSDKVSQDLEEMKNDVEAAKEDTEEAKIGSGKEKNDTEGAKYDVKNAKDDAQEAEDNAEEAKDDVEEAKDDAEEAKDDAEEAKDDSEEANDDADININNPIETIHTKSSEVVEYDKISIAEKNCQNSDAVDATLESILSKTINDSNNNVSMVTIRPNMNNNTINSPQDSEPPKFGPPSLPMGMMGAERRRSISVKKFTGKNLNKVSFNSDNSKVDQEVKIERLKDAHERYDTYLRKNEAAILKFITLDSRKSDTTTATLVSSSMGGWIRFWCVEYQGGLLGQFNGTQHQGESVQSMYTDNTNKYLFTGDSEGYVKVWNISKYCINPEFVIENTEDLRARREKLKLFPLWKYFKESIRRRVFKQERFRPPPTVSNPQVTWFPPELLNSFRAHASPITGIAYSMSKKKIITCSDDSSVRVYSLYGQFLGIFGQPAMWVHGVIDPEVYEETVVRIPPSRFGEIKLDNVVSLRPLIPADVKEVSSATSFRTLYRGLGEKWSMLRNLFMIFPRFLKKIRVMRQEEGIPPQEVKKKVNAKRNMNNDFTLAEVREQIKEAKARVPTSKILGVSYKPIMRHKPFPDIPIQKYCGKFITYANLPLINIGPQYEIEEPCDTLKEIQKTREIFRDNVNVAKNKNRQNNKPIVADTKFKSRRQKIREKKEEEVLRRKLKYQFPNLTDEEIENRIAAELFTSESMNLQGAATEERLQEHSDIFCGEVVNNCLNENAVKGPKLPSRNTVTSSTAVGVDGVNSSTSGELYSKYNKLPSIGET